MKKLKLVIVGGVAGGANSATKARRANELAQIIMFEKGPYVSFANCGLPYFVGEEIKNKDSLLVQTPEKMWERYRVETKINHEVLSINRNKKSVKVKNLLSQEEFEQEYDKLILSPGTSAFKPKIQGVDSKNVFVLKTVPDSELVKKYIKENGVKKATVVGCGFIGMELAEQLSHIGIDVTMVELADHVLPPLDLDMARLFEKELSKSKVKFIVKDGIKGFDLENDLVKGVITNSGKNIPSDMVLLTIGVRPEIQLAKDSGLEIGKTNGIVTNEYLQTSDPDIYAVGDSAETKNFITGLTDRFQLAGPASKQGRIAGQNAVSEQKLKFKGSIGTAILECLGTTVGMCGLTEASCQKIGMKYKVNIIHTPNHVKFYPGASNLSIKVLSDPNQGKILGAQVVGKEGVDKRIDVFATAIYGGMTIHDLETLDLAYSPQYGASKDPVIMLGFSAHDTDCGDVQTLTMTQFLEKDLSNCQVVDVRTEKEYKEGHIDKAINVSVDSIRDKLDLIDKDKEIVVYCQAGFRGYLAARILVQSGFKNVKNLQGGWLSADVMINPPFK